MQFFPLGRDRARGRGNSYTPNQKNEKNLTPQKPMFYVKKTTFPLKANISIYCALFIKKSIINIVKSMV